MLKHVPVRHVLYLMNYVLYCKIIREDICKRSPSLGNPESAQHVMNLLNYMHCTVPESVQHVLNLMNYMYCTVPESAQHVLNLLNYMNCTVPESVQHVLYLMNYVLYCT